ncbi:fibronectin type III domain-containing protein, partial [Candidatus Aerophobetes bacterium]|nr:fibronectin type III domain-containing protein [Candidatus Aerophobetes bacterium]
ADIAYYNIYKATTSGGQSYVSPDYQVSAGTTTYTDTSTTSAVTYYYVVRAQDTTGNIETNTTEVSATAGIPTGPSFSSLTADESAYKDGDTITLTVTLANHNTGCTLTANFSNMDDQYVTGGESVENWGTDGTDNNGDGHTDEPAEQGVYVISYLISAVNGKADGSHSVPVTATDAASNSATSSISLTLDNTAPPAPTSLSATAISGGSIQLTWTASSPETDVAQYNIYRATTSGGQSYTSPTYTVSVGTTSYTDTTVTDGVTYYYVVRARDAAGNIETNTNEVSATATVSGPSATVSQIDIKYGEDVLYDLTSSTDSDNPTVFAKGKIDEIYLRLDLHGGFELSETSSSIILFKDVGESAEEVPGTQEINAGTDWAELIFHLDPVFNPALDRHSRDDTYWVDASAVSTTGTSNDFDFYFVYDTTSPEVPDFGIASFNSSTGMVSVSGSTKSDASDPQEVEVFLNGQSQGTVTADTAGYFSKDNISLASRDNFITVQSADKAGNKSTISGSLHLEYDPQSLLSLVVRSSHVVRSGSATIPVRVIYSVTEPAEVAILVYSLHGEIVKEWSEWVSPGEEPEWSWFGENMYGEMVNNGVYILKVTARDSGGRTDNVTKLLGVLR